MRENNTNSKGSEYNSKIEEYMEEQENYSSNDLINDDDFIHTSNIGSSDLDNYVNNNGDDSDDSEDIKINYCSICGNELKNFNYGTKCDDCVKKSELVPKINKLLDYVSPSEKIIKENLLNKGFDDLDLNIIIYNLLNENLIVLSSDSTYLADVKTLNNFFSVYGSPNDILDESLYKYISIKEDVVDISKYSDLVKILFNMKNNKYEVNLYRNNRFVLKKFFVNIIDANNFAIQYLKEMGELNKPYNKKPINQKKGSSKYSNHENVFFSTKRNQWFVKIKGFKRYKIVGFYDTEEEAVIARDKYLDRKRRSHDKPKYVKKESDAKIAFSTRSNSWVVTVKNKKGKFKRLGYFDTEEEAITAKNEYYGITNEVEEQ